MQAIDIHEKRDDERRRRRVHDIGIARTAATGTCRAGLPRVVT